MLSLRVLLPAVCVFALFLWHSPAASASPEVTNRARKFLEVHTKKLRPLEVAASVAWWDANTSGKDEDFQRKEETQNKIDEALGDRTAFADIKDLKEQPKQIDDPVLRRAINVLYLTYLEKQVDKELLKKMVEKANAVEQAFNKFRATVDGNGDDRQRGPQGPQGIEGLGPAAGSLGSEQEGRPSRRSRPEGAGQAAQRGGENARLQELPRPAALPQRAGRRELIKLFDELDELTREPFRAAKKEIDARLAANVGVKVDQLMPWHYHDPFFQETPAVFKTDIDVPFKNADLVALARDFYKSIDLPIDRVIAKSDLKERKGKSPHAFCTDIDRAGDVRVLANIVQNNYWMSTLLHEFGHSVYSTNNNDIPESLPYVLRLESHILTTEGVAMMFERLSKQRGWLEKMGVPMADPAGFADAGARTLRAPAPHLLALVPGDAPLREGDVRGPGPGFE